ncbi:glutamine synthetase family protein [Streptomyces sp. NPDC048825]|uniref:glutamine synthetase family protein n=1 Tax=Streptomyces sp. NPDC048825 TaxID=3365592 RepID=UPI003717813F
MRDQTSPRLNPVPPPPILTRDELGALAQDRDIHTVMVGTPDMWGRLKGKLVNALHFLTRLPAGPEMCAYVLASDVDMTPLPGYELTGWHDGYRDLRVIPDLSTIRRLSYLPGTVLVHGDAAHPDGHPVQVAPRHMLRDQLTALAAHGLEARVGIESEFMLYKGTETQARRTGFRGLKPISPHNLDYALDHPPALSEFLCDLRDALYEADAPVEAVKTEGAPGQIEVTWPYGDPMRACDTYTVHQHAVRHIAAQHRMTPTFMAAPQTGIGSGLHLHVSLWRNDGPVFDMHPHDELPELLRHSIAGLISALPHLVPLYAPTPNSYKRYARHSFAPTNYTWGRDNRTCAVRVVGHHENTHLEVRLPGADANPYLALSATIAAIIHGISDHPKLPDSCTGDAYDAIDPLTVPRHLEEALTDFRDSEIALRAFGPTVVRHYAHAAEIEIDAHHGQVTDVELKRGFDRA